MGISLVFRWSDVIIIFISCIMSPRTQLSMMYLAHIRVSVANVMGSSLLCDPVEAGSYCTPKHCT